MASPCFEHKWHLVVVVVVVVVATVVVVVGVLGTTIIVINPPAPDASTHPAGLPPSCFC